MIVWIASYPRSGNSLARALLYQTMGLKTYTDDFPMMKLPQTETFQETASLTGTALVDDPNWEAFYERAKASAEVFLIKTHEPPRDESPVIHVVRDGRQACISYFHFLSSRFPEAKRSLLDVIAGNDRYSHWSRHYSEWAHREKRLMVRFEEMVHPSPELLASLSEFVGFEGEVKPWKNPFDRLHQLKPDTFREGKDERNYPPEWNEAAELLFRFLHAELNRGLGYAEESSEESVSRSAFEDLARFIDMSGQQIRFLHRKISGEENF